VRHTSNKPQPKALLKSMPMATIQSLGRANALGAHTDLRIPAHCEQQFQDQWNFELHPRTK